MTDQNAPARKHYATAREHLANMAAVRERHHELAAQHLAERQQQTSEETNESA